MAENEESEERRASEMFDEAMTLFNKLGNISEPTNSNSVQVLIKKAMHVFEDVTRLISIAGVFSPNESVEEIATNDLKFLLLPAVLGTLTLKLCVEDRTEVVSTAEVYFRDFLTRCNDYGVVDIEVPQPAETSDKNAQSVQRPTQPSDLVTMAVQRNSKLQRYKEKKELESRLEVLSKEVNDANVDEETKRKFYITLIKSFANQAVDELNSIEMEKPLIEHMKNVRKGAPLGLEEEKSKSRYPHTRKPLQPVIITRDEIQKKVFGAGYPSLPVMTVEEFYEKRVQDGDFPDPCKMKTRALQDFANRENAAETEENEEIKKEVAVEQDDPESLKRAREFDEYKDDHRRGWGNRMNRS